MTHHLIAFSWRQSDYIRPLALTGLTHLDCDVGQAAVLDLLVFPVVIEVAPVLPVSITAVAVLELHPWLLLGAPRSQLMPNCRALLTLLPRVARPASAARLVLTLRAGSTLSTVLCLPSTFYILFIAKPQLLLLTTYSTTLNAQKIYNAEDHYML